MLCQDPGLSALQTSEWACQGARSIIADTTEPALRREAPESGQRKGNLPDRSVAQRRLAGLQLDWSGNGLMPDGASLARSCFNGTADLRAPQRHLSHPHA